MSPLRATGLTLRASITTFDTWSIHRPNGWRLLAFPVWMWRNREVREFVDWLRAHNAEVEPGKRVAFHGLDLYSLYNSIRSVLDYLDSVDPRTAAGRAPALWMPDTVAGRPR